MYKRQGATQVPQCSGATKRSLTDDLQQWLVDVKGDQRDGQEAEVELEGAGDGVDVLVLSCAYVCVLPVCTKDSSDSCFMVLYVHRNCCGLTVRGRGRMGLGTGEEQNIRGRVEWD